MDHLFRLKDTLVGYLSPSKRRRTVGPGTPTRDATSPELPMSAPGGLVKRRIKIVREYHVQPFTPTDTKKFPAGSRKRAREDDDEDEEYDEQEVEEARGVVEAEDVDQEMIYEVEEDSQQFLADSDDDEEEGSEESDERSDAQSIDSDDSVDPEESASQLVQNDEDLTGEIGDDNIMEAESELSAEAKVKLYLEKQKQLETIRGKIDDTISKGDWTEDESFLLQKLAARSFEPLLPAEWQIDFRTWPQILFTLDDKKTFINYNCTSSSRGVKALQSLVALAGRVRDKKAANRSDERLMFIEVNRYIRWSQDDGGYSKLRFIPNIVAVAGQPGKTPDMLSREITSQMQFLAGVYRKSLEMPPARLNELGEKEMFYSRTPPVIYGIVIANSHTIFWTLDSSKVDAKPKFIWHFDFSEKHMDVWNAIAVAIFVVMARNYMMSIKHELEEETQVESDPDL